MVQERKILGTAHQNGLLQFVQKSQLANGENCGTLQVLNDVQTLKLNVIACDESMEFICEVNAHDFYFSDHKHFFLCVSGSI
jgi:hypothetical protein